MTRRVPPKEWVDALASAFPQDRMTEYPVFMWEEGRDYVIEGNTHDEVVQRWMLYGTYPAEAFNPLDAENGEWNAAVLKEFQGPSPESLTTIVRIPEKGARVVRVTPGTGFVNQRMWEIFQVTGRVSRPIWCIQGHHGGTPMRYQPIERARCIKMGLPQTPPMPGTLPYADFDNRVIEALKQREMIYDTASKVGKRKRMVGYLNKENGRKAIEMLDSWLAERTGDIAEIAAIGIRDGADVPVTDVNWIEQEAKMVHDREMSDPADVLP